MQCDAGHTRIKTKLDKIGTKKQKQAAVEESINWANKESKAAITGGLRSDDNKMKDTCFKSATVRPELRTCQSS